MRCLLLLSNADFFLSLFYLFGAQSNILDTDIFGLAQINMKENILKKLYEGWLSDISSQEYVDGKVVALAFFFVLLHSPGFAPFTAAVLTVASFKADHVTAS